MSTMSARRPGAEPLRLVGPIQPSPEELDRILVIVGGTQLVPIVEQSGFAFAAEGDLIDDEGEWIPHQRTRIEAAARAGRQFVFLCKRSDLFAVDSIGRLFKMARIALPRTETIDPQRFSVDPVGEATRAILGLDPRQAEESNEITHRGLGTPIEELAKRYGQLQWVWKDWLAKGLLTLVTGESGAGKTTVIVDLLLRLYEGYPLPGETTPVAEIKGKKALFIDADLRASHQLTDLLTKYKVAGSPFDVFEVLDPDNNPRTISTFQDEPGLFEILEQTLKEGGYWLLVVDTVSRFAGTCELASPHEISQYAGPLQRIARNLRIPVILLGHSNAMGGAYGRHLVAACQLGWKVSADRELSCARSYAAPPKPLRFAFSETGPLEWGQGQPGGVRDRTELQRLIVGRLEALAGVHGALRDSQNGWSDLWGWALDNGHLRDTGKSKFKRAMDHLVAHGLVIKTSVTSKNNKPFSRYSLPAGEESA